MERSDHAAETLVLVCRYLDVKAPVAIADDRAW